jgi:hypothetical protein
MHCFKFGARGKKRWQWSREVTGGKFLVAVGNRTPAVQLEDSDLTDGDVISVFPLSRKLLFRTWISKGFSDGKVKKKVKLSL